MQKKIFTTLAVIALILLPFLLSFAIGSYSPYSGTNSFIRYVIIWAVVSVLTTAIVFVMAKRFQVKSGNIQVSGTVLFLLLCPLFGIYGLVSAPDLSLKMLEHPEREHLRYIFLFMGAALFAAFTILFFRKNAKQLNHLSWWIMSGIFVLALAEFTWEFSHHYRYPEAMSAWIKEGKKVEDFARNYDNFDMITTGVIGRLLQFTFVMWLSIHLYRFQQVKIWSPIITVFFGLLGMLSATLIFITQMNLPDNFKFLFLFFIPGIPFFLLYWLGVALLTNFVNTKSNEYVKRTSKANIEVNPTITKS